MSPPNESERHTPVIDCHVHLVADGVHGCSLSPRFKKSAVFWFLSWMTGLKAHPSGSELGECYLDRIVDQLERAPGLDGVVLLAFDGRYDHRGVLDREHSSMVTTNDYCFEACRRDPRLYPGASINPRRPDALDELEKVAENGAVLVKAMGSTQDFDPSDPAYRPFWRRMAELGMPLLAHTGWEHTLSVTCQEYGDPERLIPALEEGVTVIAAHSGTGGWRVKHETFPQFVGLVGKFPNLYGDLAALSNFGRARYLSPIVRQTELHDRLVYGSDYPVPANALRFATHIGLGQALRINRRESLLSAPLAIARAMNLPDHVFTRTASLLRLNGRTPEHTVKRGPHEP